MTRTLSVCLEHNWRYLAGSLMCLAGFIIVVTLGGLFQRVFVDLDERRDKHSDKHSDKYDDHYERLYDSEDLERSVNLSSRPTRSE